jgi:hypothetical protein
MGLRTIKCTAETLPIRIFLTKDYPQWNGGKDKHKNHQPQKPQGSPPVI